MMSRRYAQDKLAGRIGKYFQSGPLETFTPKMHSANNTCKIRRVLRLVHAGKPCVTDRVRCPYLGHTPPDISPVPHSNMGELKPPKINRSQLIDP